MVFIIPAKHKYFSILMLAFSAKPHCASVLYRVSLVIILEIPLNAFNSFNWPYWWFCKLIITPTPNKWYANICCSRFYLSVNNFHTVVVKKSMGINEVKSSEKLRKMVGRNVKYMQFVVNVLKHAKPPLSYPIIIALHGMFFFTLLISVIVR